MPEKTRGWNVASAMAVSASVRKAALWPVAVPWSIAGRGQRRAGIAPGRRGREQQRVEGIVAVVAHLELADREDPHARGRPGRASTGRRGAGRHGRCRRSPPPGRRRSSSAPRAPRRRGPRRGSAAPRPCRAATRRQLAAMGGREVGLARRLVGGGERLVESVGVGIGAEDAGRPLDHRAANVGDGLPGAEDPRLRAPPRGSRHRRRNRASRRRCQSSACASASRPAPSSRSALTSSSAACGNISKTSAAGCSAFTIAPGWRGEPGCRAPRRVRRCRRAAAAATTSSTSDRLRGAGDKEGGRGRPGRARRRSASTSPSGWATIARVRPRVIRFSAGSRPRLSGRGQQLRRGAGRRLQTLAQLAERLRLELADRAPSTARAPVRGSRASAARRAACARR